MKSEYYVVLRVTDDNCGYVDLCLDIGDNRTMSRIEDAYLAGQRQGWSTVDIANDIGPDFDFDSAVQRTNAYLEQNGFIFRAQ